MKEIPLTKGKIALVDDADYEAVMQFKWFAFEDTSGVWYARRNVRKSEGTWTTQTLHRFLMPGVPRVDHKDRDGLNCQRENMRSCTYSQNGANRKAIGKSRFLGVSWYARLGKWAAKIKFQLKEHWLGLFESEEDAARAYDAAAMKYHGDFARLNFPVHNSTSLTS